MAELTELQTVYERPKLVDAPRMKMQPRDDVGFIARAAVRAAWVYLVAFFICQPDALWSGFTPFGIGGFWDTVVTWTARVVFHDAHTLGVFSDEAGYAGRYEYYHSGIALSFAMVVGPMWAMWDARRRTTVDREAKLRVWLAATARMLLALQMFGYGLAKVFPQQFAVPALIPPLEVLAQPYGNNSPEGILWFLMGHSRLYQVWGGALELLGGILLLRRKTAGGGALLLVGVIGNVVFLDYGFDVGPRLWAFELWILALILAAPALRRAIDVFVRNVPSAPEKFTPLSDRPRTRRIIPPIFVVYVIGFTFTLLQDALRARREWRTVLDSHVARTFSGIYDVTSFVRGTDTLPPLFGAAARWHRVIVEPNGTTVIRFMNDSLRRYWAQIDTTEQLLTLRVTPFKEPYVLEASPNPLPDSGALHFRVDRSAPGGMILHGQVGKDSVTVALQRADDPPLRRPRSFFIYHHEMVVADSAR